ncbi:MAG: 1-deoxy-D-xylulose-5-phosphate reductoisomerase [bacterium]
MKRVILLGSSGSIGQSACKVARALPDRMKIVGMAVHSSADILRKQMEEFNPKAVAITDENAAQKFSPPSCRFYKGEEGLTRLVEETEADLVLVAIVGTSGLKPALAALKAGKDLAVASKEILVMAGEIVMATARENGRLILPVDSEHNAIFQCLQGARHEHVRRLILTASGGPFRKTPEAELARVTVEQALRHPTWKMGKKITIDSATLFNKGLEMIEARWLFDVDIARVEVCVHPESIVHSMVEFVDRSVLAQMSRSDMCFPIQYAVTYPERVEGDLPRLDLAKLGKLTFEEPDHTRFPALRLARQAGEDGGALPAVFNAANEVAVEKFLAGQSSFPKIWETVETVMNAHQKIASPSLFDILEADSWARRQARQQYPS